MLSPTEQLGLLSYFAAVTKALRRMDKRARASMLTALKSRALEMDKLATPKAGGRQPRKDRRK